MDIKNQENIHYRAGSKASHAGVETLRGEREIPRIIIERIEFVENATINGRSEKNMWFAHFQPNNGWTDLPMCLNQTNCKRISKLYPECEGYLARLHNIAVRLTSEPCKDPDGGGQTIGLRISKIPASSEQEMKKWMQEHGYAPATPAAKKVITDDKVGTIVDWAKRGGLTIEKVAEKYDFASESVRKTIALALSNDLPE